MAGIIDPTDPPFNDAAYHLGPYGKAVYLRKVKDGKLYLEVDITQEIGKTREKHTILAQTGMGGLGINIDGGDTWLKLQVLRKEDQGRYGR